MKPFEIVSYGTTFAILGLILLTGIFRRLKSRVYIYFFIYNAVVMLYVVAAFLSEQKLGYDWALLTTRSALFMSAFIPLPFLLFSLEITKKKLGAVMSKLIYVFPVIVAGFAYTPFAIKTVEFNQVGTSIGQVGIALFLTLIYFVSYFGYSLFILRRLAKKEVGSQKVALNLIIIGVMATVALNMVTQIIFPAVGLYIWGDLVGTPSLIIMVGLIAYAIYRHDFLDVKYVAARGVAYVLSFVTIIAIFVTVAFFLGQVFVFQELQQAGIKVQLYYVTLATFIALLFQPTLAYFNKISDKLFYRERYDAGQLLSRLSSIMAEEIDYNLLIRNVFDEIYKTLKCRYVWMVMADNSLPSYSYPQNYEVPYKLSEIRKDIVKMPKGILISDVQTLDKETLATFQKYNIAALAPIKSSKGTVGFLVFGAKTSGYIYSKQDADMIDTLSSSLAISLDNSLAVQEIKNFNTNLQDRIHQATQDLEKANDELKTLDKAKDEFISMTSHQLRTPLSAISGYMELLLFNMKRGANVSDTLEPTIRKALNNATYMSDLVNDLLNISRMDAGKFFLEFVTVDLKDMLGKVIEQLEMRAQQNFVRLSYDAPAHDHCVAYVDKDKTRQAMVNLIDNAIQYSPKGKVDVRLDCNPKYITFTVTDNGIGVPPEAQKQIFERFFRASNTKNVRPDGTGLGLYMAKRIIDEQGGKMIFKSQLGVGSVFGFQIPTHYQKPNQPAPKPAVASASAK